MEIDDIRNHFRHISFHGAQIIANLVKYSQAPCNIDQAEAMLQKFSDIIGGFGVESLPYPDTYHDEPICLYANTGDTYSNTIVWDGTDYRLSSGWGTELEAWEADEEKSSCPNCGTYYDNDELVETKNGYFCVSCVKDQKLVPTWFKAHLAGGAELTPFFRDELDKAEEFPAYAFPGGYPLVYLDKDNETLCPKCSNDWSNLGKEVYPLAVYTHLEGSPEYCSECNDKILSAYGDPDCEHDFKDKINKFECLICGGDE